MNPGEQSSNPLGGKSSRYFGNRPRRTGNTRRFGAPQQSQYINQQPSFSTPMPAQMPAPQRKRSKKPLIFGVLVLAIITVIIVVATTVIPKAVETIGKNNNFEELLSLLNTYKENVNYYEYTYIEESEMKKISLPKGMSNEELKAYKSELSNNLAKVIEFREKLNEYGGLEKKKNNNEEYDLNALLKSLKESLDERLKYYKKFEEIYGTILDIYINEGGQENLNSLKSKIGNDKGNELTENLTTFFTAKKEFLDNNCKETLNDNCKALNKTIITSNRSLMSNTLIGEIMLQEASKQKQIESPVSILGTFEVIGRSVK